MWEREREINEEKDIEIKEEKDIEREKERERERQRIVGSLRGLKPWNKKWLG